MSELESKSGEPTSHVACDGQWIFMYRDEYVYREPLSIILNEAGYGVLLHDQEGSVLETLQAAPQMPELLILPIDSSYQTLVELEELREEIPEMAKVPIVGMTLLDRSDLDSALLRNLGVMALMDKGTTPEMICFCCQRLMRTPDSGRRAERAPCFLPADVECNGLLTTEYIQNLSSGGVQLASCRPFEVNDSLRISFPLRTLAGELIRMTGSVVYCDGGSREYAPFVAGVVFSHVADHDRAILSSEVDQLLRTAPREPSF